MLRTHLYASFILITLTGCISSEQIEVIKSNRIDLSSVNTKYYSNKSVTSLEIPPDLTSPNYQNSFRISEYASGVSFNTVNLTNKELEKVKVIDKISKNADIQVKKNGIRRWLIVDLNTDIVWDLSKQFLKEKGFAINKSNKKIGIMETDYLENNPKIPDRSLGFFRSFLASKVDNVSYTLPSVDSYRIRVEPIDSGQKSEVHLTLNSMSEVITGSGSNESTLWQSKEKDLNLEAKMLYELMLFLGGDSASAMDKIKNAKEEQKVSVNISKDINGFAKLIFDQSLIDTWDSMSWALSELNINLEDKDIKERAFYLKQDINSNKGFMTLLFGENTDTQKSIQLRLKMISDNTTEVYFNDISELNDDSIKEYSSSFFKKIRELFI